MKTLKNLFSQRAYFTIYIFIFSVLFIYAAKMLYVRFPNEAYTWGEVFINYEGGFVRRALLGELLFLADPYIPVRIFYTSMYSVVFIFFVYFSYKKLMSVFDPLVVALLFSCPGLFLFNIFDINIFGRKYIFMYLMLLGMAQVCIGCLTKKSGLCRNTLAVAGLFIAGCLIYEVTIFYFPLFAVLLGVAYARAKKTITWLLITGFLLGGAVLVIVFFGAGSTDIRDAVFASWARRYPDYTSMGGLYFIGDSLSISLRKFIELFYSFPKTVGSIFLVLFLSVIPLVFLWKAHNLHKAVKELLSISVILRISFLLAALAPIGVFLIAADYGTFISTTLMAYLYFLYAVFSVQPQTAAAWLPKLKGTLGYPGNALARLLLLIYMLGWSIIHFVGPGGSFFQWGIIFKLKDFF